MEEGCSAQMPQTIDTFTREHTLFMIDLMRRHLEANGDQLPRTLAELNSRIKAGKGSKKRMWEEMSNQLSDRFGQVFDPTKLNRKWCTLVDAYKKIKDNNRSTGRGAMRFKYFNEMDALLGSNHDVEFPVVGTSSGIQVRRPVFSEGGEVIAGSQAGSQASQPAQARPASPSPQGTAAVSVVNTPSTVNTLTVNTPRATTPRPRFRAQNNELVELLRESEAATQRRHSELLTQMNRAQQSFEDMIREYLSKS